MFLRFDEDKPQFMQVMLTGVEGTPYSSGCFVFDIFVPNDYPATSCLVTHTTKNAGMVSANNGPGGFSPNLHKDSGKVCLSLLGTWDGPGWDPASSSIYQVVSSILWCILGAMHPYYMEPDFGGWEGTAPADDEEHDPEVIEYDEAVYFGTAKWAILEQMKHPPEGFEEVMRAHFRTKKHVILKQIQAWVENGSENLRAQLEPVVEELQLEFRNLLTEEQAEEELRIALQEVEFVTQKMAYLRAKVDGCRAAGRDPSSEMPKALQRLGMGPRLLRRAKERVRDKTEQLEDVRRRIAAGPSPLAAVEAELPEDVVH